MTPKSIIPNKMKSIVSPSSAWKEACLVSDDDHQNEVQIDIDEGTGIIVRVDNAKNCVDCPLCTKERALFCGKARAKAIEQHTRVSHGMSLSWQCQTCDLVSPSIRSLNLHGRVCAKRNAKNSSPQHEVVAKPIATAPSSEAVTVDYIESEGRLSFLVEHLGETHGINNVGYRCPLCVVFCSDNHVSVRSHIIACRRKKRGAPALSDRPEEGQGLNASGENAEPPIGLLEDDSSSTLLRRGDCQTAVEAAVSSSSRCKVSTERADVSSELTVFTVSEVCEVLTEALGNDSLHVRYRAFLLKEKETFRCSGQEIDQSLVDAAAERYAKYLRCGRSIEVPKISDATKQGLRIVKLRSGPRQALSAIAFHVLDNLALWKRVQEKITTQITENLEYYRKVTQEVTEANIPV